MSVAACGRPLVRTGNFPWFVWFVCLVWFCGRLALKQQLRIGGLFHVYFPNVSLPFFSRPQASVAVAVETAAYGAHNFQKVRNMFLPNCLSVLNGKMVS